MDFMKLLKSIEELLYELISWFIFYPLTLWRIFRAPLAMMTYAQKELTDKPDLQFDDTLSPPIVLLLTLVLLHLLQIAVPSPATDALPGLFQDDRNLLVFRALAFSLFPLVFATVGLRASGSRLTRTTLKPAFYSQSFAAVPFVLSVSLGAQLAEHHSQLWGGPLAGGLVMLLGVIWYLTVQTTWFARDDRTSRGKALLSAVLALLVGVLLLVISSVLAQMAAVEMDASSL